jgi:hypothetical protein
MYHKGATMGEKSSKEQRLTTTEQQKILTSSPKIALQIDPPHLCCSKGIAAIRIEFLID